MDEQRVHTQAEGVLRTVHALITPADIHPVEIEKDNFPVTASVIIPCKNRARTVRDAITRALSQQVTAPYSFNVFIVDDNSTDGVLYYTDEQVTKFCKAANRAGMQIELHAIGDRAFAQAAAALKAALDDYPRDDHRHGIIHACLTTEESRKICADYHIQLPMQVSFDNWRQEPAEYTERILGRERNAALNPVRTMKDLGCTIGFGSDGPCTDPNPIVWLYKAVNHSNPNERVSIQDALRMSTYNGYWISFDEQERGSLEAGKVADMVILSHNPYELAPEELMKNFCTFPDLDCVF